MPATETGGISASLQRTESWKPPGTTSNSSSAELRTRGRRRRCRNDLLRPSPRAPGAGTAARPAPPSGPAAPSGWAAPGPAFDRAQRPPRPRAQAADGDPPGGSPPSSAGAVRVGFTLPGSRVPRPAGTRRGPAPPPARATARVPTAVPGSVERRRAPGSPAMPPSRDRATAASPRAVACGVDAGRSGAQALPQPQAFFRVGLRPRAAAAASTDSSESSRLAPSASAMTTCSAPRLHRLAEAEHVLVLLVSSPGRCSCRAPAAVPPAQGRDGPRPNGPSSCASPIRVRAASRASGFSVSCALRRTLHCRHCRICTLKPTRPASWPCRSRMR